MNRISIGDISMKQAGLQLSFKEKLELSKLLDQLGVNVIELPPIKQLKADSLLVKSVASAVRNAAVALPVELSAEGVSLAWNALKEAAHPRLQVAASLSPAQMEYLYHKKPAAMLEAIKETVAACREKTSSVEFVADDATRADRDYLIAALSAAARAGAELLTICDTAGNMLPGEFAAFIEEIKSALPVLKERLLGVSCADTLSLASACAAAAITSGIQEIKAAAYPTEAAPLADLAQILSVKGEQLAAASSIRVVEMKRLMGQIAWICEAGKRKSSALEGSIRESGEDFALSVHDEKTAVLHAAEKLGYSLSEEDAEAVYEAFLKIAARKDRVSARELDAIIASAALQVPPAYIMDKYQISTGNTIMAMAHIRLTREGKELEGIALGDGPIDAAFKALEQITGHHYELDDFQIQAVTEGHEAMGETVVRLISEGRLYSGRGISTDIVGSSIRAYVNALNKIVYEETEA